jgi:hypothetical protein
MPRFLLLIFVVLCGAFLMFAIDGLIGYHGASETAWKVSIHDAAHIIFGAVLAKTIARCRRQSQGRAAGRQTRPLT